MTGVVVLLIVCGMWLHDQSETSKSVGVHLHTPQTITDLQKSLLHCRKEEVAPNNLPIITGPFLGRSNSVQNLTRLFFEKYFSGVKAVGIYGSPAVGKSTLAIHTAHEISQCGIEVWYIDLFDIDHLFEHHSEATKSVPVTSSPDPWASTSVLFETPNGRKKALSLSAQGLLEWAKGVKKDTLLVLDNCDNILGIEEHGQKLEKLIITILEQSSSTLRLIVTSRRKIAIPGLGFKTYYLRELDNESAIQLLQSNHLLSENDSKQKKSKRIAALVDNNPLALHICASLIDETYSASELIAGLIDTPMEVLSADILPDIRKMVLVLQLSYKHLHNTTRSCGHYLSLFPGSFTEDAASEVLSMSQFSDPKGCLRSLCDRSLIRPYELAGQLGYQHHRLIKEFFNYMLKNSKDLEFDAVVKIFQTSFELYFSSQLYNMGETYNISSPRIEEVIGRFEFDSHNFISLLDLIAIHPPLSVETVVKTAHSLVNSDLVLNIITETELFRSLKAISLVLLYNNNEVVPILSNKMPSFWAKIFTRLHTIAISSTTFSECRTLCMETFEFPSNVSSVIYDIMATEYYVPRFAMHCDWLICWSGAGCVGSVNIILFIIFIICTIFWLEKLETEDTTPTKFALFGVFLYVNSFIPLLILSYTIGIYMPLVLMFVYVYVLIIYQDQCSIVKFGLLVSFVYAIVFMNLDMRGWMLTTLTQKQSLELSFICTYTSFLVLAPFLIIYNMNVYKLL